jgi:hypothetical protein
MARMNSQALRRRSVPREMVAVLIAACATFAALATGVTLPSAAAKPLADTDARGFVNSAARCDPPQTVVVIGRTKLSQIAICADGRGGYEYRGVRVSDQAVMRLPATALANGCFGAHTEQVVYTVSEHKLLLTSGIRIMRDEAMIEFKDFRTPDVGVVTQMSGR